MMNKIIRRVNVGTIGHVDYGKTTLTAAIQNAVDKGYLSHTRTNKSDRKRNRKNRWG